MGGAREERSARLQRVEPKDYLDIEALLRSGLSLSSGLSAAAALFPNMLNPLDAAKAVAWFRDGDAVASSRSMESGGPTG